MHATFEIAPRSEILTPEAPGLTVLVDGLRRGHSLWASQSGTAITTRADATPFLYCETSGSSGQPKVIRRRPASWIASFAINARTFDLGPADRYATLGHPGHSLSLFAVLEALHIGADIAVLAGMSPRRQTETLAELAISVIYATPTQLRLLTRLSKDATQAVLPKVRRLFCGGGKLDPALRADLCDLLPHAEVREFFGASETSFITMSDGNTPTGSVGRAYPGVALRVAAPHETAEILVHSPYVFDGYEVGETQDTHWQDGYLGIGEMGYLDAAGYLFLRGRKRRMVTVADHNVFPEEIEQLVLTLPGVTGCAVLAIPDALRGHKLICFLTGRFDEPSLRRTCRAAFGPAAVPQRFVLLDAMPLLSAGKPDLPRLAAMVGGN